MLALPTGWEFLGHAQIQSGFSSHLPAVPLAPLSSPWVFPATVSSLFLPCSRLLILYSSAAPLLRHRPGLAAL